MRALAQDEERVAFWWRHTVSGIVLCEVLPAIIAVRTWTTDPPRAGLVLAVAAVVAATAPLLALIPVDRLVRHPRGRLFFPRLRPPGGRGRPSVRDPDAVRTLTATPAPATGRQGTRRRRTTFLPA